MIDIFCRNNQRLARQRRFAFAFAATVILGSFLQAAQAAPTLSPKQQNDRQAAKDANIAEAKKLNGDSTDAKNKEQNNELKNAVNQVPGVKVQASDLETPAEPPIKGFHPIKRLLRPVENLEGMSIKLEQQIMKLEGPIASLQPPMIGLQKRMHGVDDHITRMQDQLSGVQGQVGSVGGELSHVRGDLSGVRSDLDGVRADLAAMRKDIATLKGPIIALQKPIEDLQQPLSQVAHPLVSLQSQLNWIILAIMISAVSIAIGTPIAAIQIYKHRKQLFPDLREHDIAKVEPPKEAQSSRR